MDTSDTGDRGHTLIYLESWFICLYLYLWLSQILAILEETEQI